MAEFGNNFDLSKFDPSQINWDALGVPNPIPATPNNGPSASASDSGDSGEREYWKNRAAQDAADSAADRTERNQTAVAFITDILRQYGMDGLGSSIESLVQQWGNNTAVIAEKIRQTDPYKARFKGMLALQAKGVTDIRNEAEYLNLETDYRSAFRENGLASFLGPSGTQGEFDKIASIVGDYSVSVAEVKSRIQDAQRVAAETPQEVKDALQKYYNVPASMLVEYTLDKTRTMDRINTIANSAVIGGYATRAGLNVDLTAAEQVSALSQGNDIGIDKLQSDLSGVKDVRDSTARLARIEDTNLSDSETLLSEMNVDTTAKKKVKDLQSRERARFAGTSGIETGSLSRNSGF